MVLATTSVHMAEQASPNASCQCLCPPGELQLPSASPGREIGRWICPGFFQIIASVLCPGSCQILCEPIKSGISILLSSPSPKSKTPLVFKAVHLRACVPSAGPLSGGSLMWDLVPFLPWGESL